MYKKLVTDYLDEDVLEYPNKVGFSDEKKDFTFYHFRERAYSVASKLISLNVTKKPVAVYLDKSVESLIVAFGAVYSSNFYTMVDTQMPTARVNKICNILKPAVIITDKMHMDKVEYSDAIIIDIEEAIKFSINYEAIRNCRDNSVDTDIVYVLFTSGSTGTPKGCIISHRNIITYMEWSFEAFGFSAKTVFGNQTPFYFSMSVLDIFQTIKCAGTLVIIPKKFFAFPVQLANYMQEKKINTIYWVPSALCQVANMGALDCKEWLGLEKVLFAGEVMPTRHLNMWMKAIPNAMYANLFGPTEVTDICTYYIVDRTLSDNESVPIGKNRACDNMDVFIIGEDGNEVKGTSEGELYVRGASVAYGYFNAPEKTSEAFVQNPLNSAYNEVVYKTGDLVHYNERGELIYISRKDFQIKHMGYRIELGEIENVVSSVQGIDRVCCIYSKELSHIVMYYTGNIDEASLKREVRKLVPKYMVPNDYFKLSEMPLNLNGKIDRNSLKEKFEKENI